MDQELLQKSMNVKVEEKSMDVKVGEIKWRRRRRASLSTIPSTSPETYRDKEGDVEKET
jgi:hypothetical protein